MLLRIFSSFWILCLWTSLFGSSVVLIFVVSNRWFSKHWTKFSEDTLMGAELKILNSAKCDFLLEKIDIGADLMINTVTVLPRGKELYPPLVLIHGYAGAIGFWVSNFAPLAENQRVIAIDMLGFGRSSRPHITSLPSADAAGAEQWWVDSIELWRQAMHIESMSLLGHSLGGYLAACYAMRYPQRLYRLILASPAGVPAAELVSAAEQQRRSREMHWVRRTLRPLLAWVWGSHISPQSVVRFLGPYHTFVDEPSGELATFHLFEPFAIAKHPLSLRLPTLSADLPILFLYGINDWMPETAARRLLETSMPHLKIVIVPNAGHQLYLENPPAFNREVLGFIEHSA